MVPVPKVGSSFIFAAFAAVISGSTKTPSRVAWLWNCSTDGPPTLPPLDLRPLVPQAATAARAMPTARKRRSMRTMAILPPDPARAPEFPKIHAWRCDRRTGSQVAHGRGHLRATPNRSIISVMEWTTPSYELLKMDAEIGSYQEDGEWPPIVESD